MASQSGARSAASTTLSWAKTWLNALTRPSVTTFAAIASDGRASPTRTYAWLIISILIRAIFNFVAQALYGLPPAPNGSPANGAAVQGFSTAALIRDLPISFIFGIAGFIVVVGVINFGARALGGTGRYAILAYTVAAYIAPLGIITSIIAVLPLVSPLNVIVALYGIVLTVIAVKAVYRFGWGQAIASSVIIWIVIAALMVCLAVVGFALLGSPAGVLSNNTVGL